MSSHGHRLKKLTLELLKQIKAWRSFRPPMPWEDVLEELDRRGIVILRSSLLETCRRYGRSPGPEGWTYEAWCAPERGRGGWNRGKKSTPKSARTGTRPVSSGVPIIAPISAPIKSQSLSPLPTNKPPEVTTRMAPIAQVDKLPEGVTKESQVDAGVSRSSGANVEQDGPEKVMNKSGTGSGQVSGTEDGEKIPPTLPGILPTGGGLPAPLVPECSAEELQERIRLTRERGEAARLKKKTDAEDAQRLEIERKADAARMDQAGKDLVIEELRKTDPFYKPKDKSGQGNVF
jgi:hypothetical protein